jgi:SET domain-containing protein
VAIGDTLAIAWRDIAAGEELTFDYATVHDSGLESFSCTCGSLACRGKVSAEDWKKPELQQKYGDYFTPYLLQKIKALKIKPQL